MRKIMMSKFAIYQIRVAGVTLVQECVLNGWRY